MPPPDDFPKIDVGTAFGQTFALQWQNLINTVERMARRHNIETNSLSPGQPDREVTLRNVTVVRDIITDGETPDRTALVREVRYRPEGTPVVGEYEWGLKFDAYPEVGVELAELKAFVYPEVDDTGEPRPPALETPILQARRDHEFWFLSIPVAPERLVVLREPLNGDFGSRFVNVQEVVPETDASGAWTGQYLVLGDPAITTTVNVWPTLTAGHFRPFYWIIAEINPDKTTLLPLTNYRGVWYLKQRPNRAVTVRQGRVKILDCQVPDPDAPITPAGTP